VNKPKYNVLVVDDIETNIDVLLNTLGDDYDVSVAMDGESALELVKEAPPDLILLDIMMPGLSGYEVCRRLKVDQTFSDIPIIFVTAKQEIEDETKGLALGAVDYVTKPFSPPIIRARVKNHLALKNKSDELRKLNATISDHLNSVVKILSSLIETSLPHSRGFATKIAEIAVSMAHLLKIPKQTIQDIRTAAYLREIGKIGMPADLLKILPENLPPRDLEYLKSSTLKGAGFLEDYTALKEVGIIIRHLEENFDGSGNPDGLTGEDIPIGSRVIRGVAEIYTLMSGTDGKSPSAAMEQLEELSGHIFDPQILKALHLFFQNNQAYQIDKVIEIPMQELTQGMELVSSIFLTNGSKILGKGTVMNEKSIEQALRFFNKGLIKGTAVIKQ